MNKALTIGLMLIPYIAFTASYTQSNPINVNKTIIQKLSALSPDSSNAFEVEKILGRASACLPNSTSTETWICQWKGDLSSNRVENTINITFSAGTIVQIIGIDTKGTFILGKKP